MTRDKHLKSNTTKQQEAKKTYKTKGKITTSDKKVEKKTTLKDLFERQKQHPKPSQPDRPMSLPERQKQTTTEPKRGKSNGINSSQNPTSPLAATNNNKEKLVTPLPSGKLRTPPSVEREPDYKKALLSTPEKPNMQGMEPTTGKPKPAGAPSTPATHQDLQEMETRIIAAMGRMIAPLQVDMRSNNSKLDTFSTELIALRNHNNILRSKVTNMESVNKQLNIRVSRLENQLLEKNIIIRGVKEAKWEHTNTTWEKVLAEISTTVEGNTFEERMSGAERFSIASVRRVGPRQSMTNRPILVKFHLREDAEYLVKNRKHLNKGTFLDYEYTAEVERERRLLRPILKAAREMEEFKGKCRMEGAELIIKSRRYNSQNLHALPAPLSGFNATSKSDENVLGFFGELNPLSNFHAAPFTVGTTNYHSSEQYIQHMKSELFKDTTTSTAILASSSAFECKQLSRDITNYNRDTWLDRAKELSTPGIRAKFEQNPILGRMLLNTGSLKLVESSKDKDWGTGIPITDDRCLKPDQWANQGILGKILEEVRNHLHHLDRSGAADAGTVETSMNTDENTTPQPREGETQIG